MRDGSTYKGVFADSKPAVRVQSLSDAHRASARMQLQLKSALLP